MRDDTIAGDPTLTPERAMTYEVGGDWRGWRHARLGLTLFRSNVRDFIERDVQTETFANFQHYRFQGVELTSHSEFAGHTTVDASYSFLDSVDRGDTRVFDDLQYRPRHKLALELARRFDTGTVASMNVMHVGEEMFFSRIGTPQERMLAPYTLLGARLAQEFHGRRLRVYVGASNLLDDNYAEAYGLPQAGRMVYGGIDLQLF